MATNLIDLVNSALTPAVVDRAAAYVGESGPATRKALEGIVPAIVAALASMASTSGGAQQVAQMLDSGRHDGSALDALSLFAGGAATQEALAAGKGLLGSLFGNKLDGVTDLIARSAGLRSASVTSLMALAVPVVLYFLGRQRAAAGGGMAALTTVLGEQKSFLGGLLPAGLASLLGWSWLTAPLSGLGSSAAEAAARADREVAAVTAPRPSWGIPLAAIAGLILVALGYLWLAAPAREARRMAELQLPGGLRIAVPDGAFNFSLATWLAGSTDTTVPRRFIFDNLNFETGTTTLTPESRPTVDSLVVILKAYPVVAVVLEGHTDSTGDPAANKKLSLDRATAVKTLLVSGGVADARIGTSGVGPDRPIASNDTEEGRAKNRRLELVVEKR
jgi:outer membrane protein OmpA-like peptidoglycan-associated protein